jgi:hypothetical protein
MTHGKTFNPYERFANSSIPRSYSPNSLTRYKGLTWVAKAAWGRLVQYAGKDGRCYPSFGTLAYELGISRRQAIRAVNELTKKGFLVRTTKKEPGRRAVNFYQFLDHPAVNLETSELQFTNQGLTSDTHVTNQSSTSDIHVTNQGLTSDIHVTNTSDTHVTQRQKGKTKRRFKTTTTADHPPTTQARGSTSPGGTLEGGGGEDSFFSFEEGKEEVVDGGIPWLSPKEEEYIDLKVKYEKHRNKIRGTEANYRRALKGKALAAQLNMDDLDELREWAEQEGSEAHDEAGLTAREIQQRRRDKIANSLMEGIERQAQQVAELPPAEPEPLRHFFFHLTTERQRIGWVKGSLSWDEAMGSWSEMVRQRNMRLGEENWSFTETDFQAWQHIQRLPGKPPNYEATAGDEPWNSPDNRGFVRSHSREGIAC